MLALTRLVAGLLQVTSPQPLSLTATTAFDTSITPGSVHQYLIRLRAGGSANIIIRQNGVDLVVEVYDPSGTLIATVDSPNGRAGDEPVEIITVAAGTYRLRVRPYGSGEPAGRYSVSVPALRDARATRALLAARSRARDSASAWLAARSATLGGPNAGAGALDAKFDSVARGVRVIGLGEGTHGSREFGDMRLRLTQRAIEHAGYRIVALEGSAARLARVNAYLADARNAGARLPVEDRGWIGRRSEGELIAWLRAWNARNPGQAVSLIGVDDQGFAGELAEVGAYLRRAYTDRIAARWAPIERDLAAADSQTYVFGNSRVDTTVRRELFELTAALKLDEPVLRALYGDSAYDRAAETLAIAAQFADFNDGSSGIVSHDRDWYMAAHLLRALSRRRGAKAVFWAHNSHVAHWPGRTALNGPSGSVLRAALGCDYQAIGMTFGEGSFLAQVPGDAENRLAIDTLPPNIEESVEHVMSRVASTTALTMWGCMDEAAPLPAWLRRPQLMHWIGGLWRPGTNPADANRPTRLLLEYDGLVFIPRVTAEEDPRPASRIRR